MICAPEHQHLKHQSVSQFHFVDLHVYATITLCMYSYSAHPHTQLLSTNWEGKRSLSDDKWFQVHLKSLKCLETYVAGEVEQ